MPGKGWQVLPRPITDSLDPKEDPAYHGMEDCIETVLILQAFGQIIAQEVGKLESEFKAFREICKSLSTFEQKFYSKLTTLSQKIDVIEITQREATHRVEEIEAQAVSIETKASKLENDFQQVQNKHKHLTRLERVLENVDNNSRKNNMPLKGPEVNFSLSACAQRL